MDKSRNTIYLSVGGCQVTVTCSGRQGLEHLPDRVIGAIIRHLLYRNLIVSGRKCTVVGVHIADELGIVHIPPEPGRMVPGHLALDLHAVRQLVEHDAHEVFVIFQDKQDIMERVADAAILISLEPLGPILKLLDAFSRFSFRS